MQIMSSDTTIPVTTKPACTEGKDVRTARPNRERADSLHHLKQLRESTLQQYCCATVRWTMCGYHRLHAGLIVISVRQSLSSVENSTVDYQ
jgi:hypothetical protein